QAFNRPLSDIYGVATFYSLFSVKPGVKYSIKVCHSLPCYLKEGEVILKAIEKHLNIKAGESTPDHLFSLSLVNCLGLCDISPVMLINERVYGNVEKEDIALVLDSYRENHDK
ncbi:MAG: NAD(P)H-dependent oxidoreductase subunit E, partial [bacterium]|nr:NAD(P)H-dependent oxidoreductase subunit E [bacterium]